MFTVLHAWIWYDKPRLNLFNFYKRTNLLKIVPILFSVGNDNQTLCEPEQYKCTEIVRGKFDVI